MSGCASDELRRIPPESSFEVALSMVGKRTDTGGPVGADREVVVIMDRHRTGRAVSRLRRQVQNVQRDNRLLIEYLIGHGYGLLGCEYRLGALVEDDRTRSEYVIVRSEMRIRRNMDARGVFQPIRYQMIWPDQLEVWGVEDPELYDRDVELFQLIVACRHRANRKDIDDAERSWLVSEEARALGELVAHARPRGIAAGRNMVEAMDSEGHRKAILLIGGAHAAPVVRALDAAGIRWHLFQSASYEREATQPPP